MNYTDKVKRLLKIKNLNLQFTEQKVDEGVIITEAFPDISKIKNIEFDANDSTVLSSEVFFKITFPLFVVTLPAHTSVIEASTAICVALSEGVVDDKSTAYTCLGLIKITKKIINI